MKRLSLILFVLLLAVLALASCSSEKTITLNVYNWGEYISDGSEGTLDVNKAFEEYYYEAHGVKLKVNYTTYASNEDMYAKILSGATSYDIVIPSEYMIERMINEGLLEKLDFNNIPNYQYIAEEFKTKYNYYDPNNEYTVPYTYGLVGIMYNAERVTSENIGSWDLLWDTDYAGKILQFNNSRDAFGTSLYRLGMSVNSTSREDWETALEELKLQKPLIQSYVMDEIFNKMKTNSALIAPYYAGDFLSIYEENDELAFFFPKEGTNIFIDAMCVPKGSPNKAIAEEYINFMLSEEVAVANAEYTYYASPNTLVQNNEGYQETMHEIHDDAMDILYGSTNTMKTEFYENMDTETLLMVNELWEELKIESSVGDTVYTICYVIIAVIVAGFVYGYIKKKKREALYD